jgi:hypothetical protein
MSGNKQWQNVLIALQQSAASQEAYIPREEVVARVLKLTNSQIVEARVSSYMWDIEHYGGVKVIAVRDATNKRKVLGYRLPVDLLVPLSAGTTAADPAQFEEQPAAQAQIEEPVGATVE